MGLRVGGATGTPSARAAGPSLEVEAAELRRDVVAALYAAGGGHYGGSLSVLDLILVLYRRILRVSPGDPDRPDRDRFILSKGHAAPALYAVLRRLGYFDDPLAGFGVAGGRLEGHPDMTVLPGVDFSTGSLGQGLAVGLGMATVLQPGGQQVWVVLGDGECQEGQVWEAAMLAGRRQCATLHAVVDANDHQECGWPGRPPVDDLARRWAAFGWQVREVDGHDHDALTAAMTAAAGAGGPSLLLAHTVKGRGFDLVEADPDRFHCTTVTAAEQVRLLGARP